MHCRNVLPYCPGRGGPNLPTVVVATWGGIADKRFSSCF